MREAGDGKEGLAEIERDKPDLVIVDFLMPGLSGAEVARKDPREAAPSSRSCSSPAIARPDAVKRTAPDAPPPRPSLAAPTRWRRPCGLR